MKFVEFIESDSGKEWPNPPLEPLEKWRLAAETKASKAVPNMDILAHPGNLT